MPEDPVTGSAHSMLILVGRKAGENHHDGAPVSARGGDLRCQWQGDRVLISGGATTYARNGLPARLTMCLRPVASSTGRIGLNVVLRH